MYRAASKNTFSTRHKLELHLRALSSRPLPRGERSRARCQFLTEIKNIFKLFRKLGPVISVDVCSAHLLMRRTLMVAFFVHRPVSCVKPDRGVLPHGVPLYSISIGSFFS